jgi:hypothetical protein
MALSMLWVGCIARVCISAGGRSGHRDGRYGYRGDRCAGARYKHLPTIRKWNTRLTSHFFSSLVMLVDVSW